MAANETPGGGWGSIPSNDPGERSDAASMGGKALPKAQGWGFHDTGSNPAPTGDVCNEPFDARYTGDGTDIWDAPRTVGNVPTDKEKL